MTTKPCRVCGGEVTQQSRINRYDWICSTCAKERQQRRRRETNTNPTVEGLQEELDASIIANGALRMRVYDLERSFRLAEEAGIELPDPSDYSGSGSEYVRPERARPGPVPQTDRREDT